MVKSWIKLNNADTKTLLLEIHAETLKLWKAEKDYLRIRFSGFLDYDLGSEMLDRMMQRFRIGASILVIEPQLEKLYKFGKIPSSWIPHFKKAHKEFTVAKDQLDKDHWNLPKSSIALNENDFVSFKILRDVLDLVTP